MKPRERIRCIPDTGSVKRDGRFIRLTSDGAPITLAVRGDVIRVFDEMAYAADVEATVFFFDGDSGPDRSTIYFEYKIEWPIKEMFTHFFKSIVMEEDDSRRQL